jgi:hypothetical protein
MQLGLKPNALFGKEFGDTSFAYVKVGEKEAESGARGGAHTDTWRGRGRDGEQVHDVRCQGNRVNSVHKRCAHFIGGL